MALNPFYQNLVNSGRLKLKKKAATPAAATAPTGSPRPNYALQAAQAFRPRTTDQGGGSDFSTFGPPIAQTPESRRAAMNDVTRAVPEQYRYLMQEDPTSESTIGKMIGDTKSFGGDIVDSFTRGIRSDQLPSTIGKTLLGAAAGGGIPGLIVSQLAGGVEDIFKNAAFRSYFEDAGLDIEGGPMEGGFFNTINELFGFGGIDSHFNLTGEDPSISRGTAGGYTSLFSAGGPAGIDIDIKDIRQTYEDMDYILGNPEEMANIPIVEDTVYPDFTDDDSSNGGGLDTGDMTAAEYGESFAF